MSSLDDYFRDYGLDPRRLALLPELAGEIADAARAQRGDHLVHDRVRQDVEKGRGGRRVVPKVRERHIRHLRILERPGSGVQHEIAHAGEGDDGVVVAQVALAPGESFDLQFVNGKSWSGYNYYQGNFRSLIQINTDLPIRITRAVDLGCHEGYPGHHVYNALLEQTFVRERGWVEMSVYPLFSPMSFVAEGSANYGIDLAFPGEEGTRFEREVLFRQ